jgi:hypothetical protein
LIRKDYIQRYFDELANVLAVVLQLKNDLKPIEADKKINDFAADFLKISLDEIIVVKENLIDYLMEEKNFSLDHFKILEDLLFQKHILQPEAEKLKDITLDVLHYLAQNDTNYSLERNSRISKLKQ